MKKLNRKFKDKFNPDNPRDKPTDFELRKTNLKAKVPDAGKKLADPKPEKKVADPVAK